MGPVATVAQRLARPDPRERAADVDLEIAFDHGQALDRPARVRQRLQHAARVGPHVVPLQPVDRLQPADHRETAQAVVGDEDRRRAAAQMFDERAVLPPFEHRLDRHVEGVREPPDRAQRRVGLVALDLGDDRLGDARLARKIGERVAVASAQPLDREAELVRQRGRPGLQNFRAVLAFDAHERAPCVEDDETTAMRPEYRTLLIVKPSESYVGTRRILRPRRSHASSPTPAATTITAPKTTVDVGISANIR